MTLNLSMVIQDAAQWVRAERDALRAETIPLGKDEMEALSPYFNGGVLRAARVTAGAIPTPPFLARFVAAGLPNVPDFSRMLGLTLDDTIVMPGVVGSVSVEARSTLFHELVHVVQYQKLGVEDFMRTYITSWANEGFRYERIILEMHAHGLEREFLLSASPFSVDERLSALMQGMN